jgi:hypothetical protein
MYLAGEVVTAPLEMSAALGVAFLIAWGIGGYVIRQALRIDAALRRQATRSEEREPEVERRAA